MILNDGFGLDLASLLLYGRKFPCNCNGTDFVPAFLSETRHNLRIALVGSQPDVVEKAGREIERRWPRHRVVVTQLVSSMRPMKLPLSK